MACRIIANACKPLPILAIEIVNKRILFVNRHSTIQWASKPVQQGKSNKVGGLSLHKKCRYYEQHSYRGKVHWINYLSASLVMCLYFIEYLSWILDYKLFGLYYTQLLLWYKNQEVVLNYVPQHSLHEFENQKTAGSPLKLTWVG